MQYGGFWRRLAAFFIDMLIMTPVSWAVLSLGLPSTRWFLVFWLIPGLALNLAYNVWLVSRFGGTPGMLALKLRARMLDGLPVTSKAATIRYSVLFGLAAAMAIGGAISSLRIEAVAYHSMTFMQTAAQLALHNPVWMSWVAIIFNVWLYGEFAVLLCNPKRRAIQDFMAGTVIIKQAPADTAAKLAPIT